MTPAEAFTGPVSSSTATNEGARTYTVSGLGTTPVNIALFACQNVTVDEDGNVTFIPTGTAPNEVATGLGANTNAVIEVVQGVAVGGQKHIGDDEAPVTPTNGSVTFTVDSTGFDCVIPVVFVDADNDNQLDVTATGAPEEQVGVGGAITFIPGEAAQGAAALIDAAVQYVDKEANFFVANNARYNYDEADTYSYDTDNDGTTDQTITFAQFETALSVGDTIDQTGTYSRTFSNAFGIDNDTPGTPTGVAAVAGDFDNDANDTNSDDIRVTWNAPNPPNGLIASYTVRLYDDNPDVAGCQTTSLVATETGVTTNTVDFEEVANDTYCVTVAAVSLAQQEGPVSQPAFVTVQVGAVDATAPVINNVYLQTNTTAPGRIGADDVIHFDFNESMNATIDDAGSTFRFTDPQGELFQVVCGTNVTCAQANYTPTGTTTAITNGRLVVTITADAGVVDIGGAAGDDIPQIPGTVTEVSTHWDDLAGNELNLAGSPDKTIDAPIG